MPGNRMRPDVGNARLHAVPDTRPGVPSSASDSCKTTEPTTQSMVRDIQDIHGQEAVAGADAASLAAAAFSLWTAVEGSLSPIIGERGVAALFKRSLYLSRNQHPCLSGVHLGDHQPGNFAALRTVLAQQTSSTAAAAQDALLLSFDELLTSLIGASLTERLFGSVCDNHSRGDTAQDTTPWPPAK